MGIIEGLHSEGTGKIQYAVGCPLANHFRLSLHKRPSIEKEEVMKAVPYTLTIGSLMYAMVCTRSDIEYAVGVVIRFLANPQKTTEQ